MIPESSQIQLNDIVFTPVKTMMRTILPITSDRSGMSIDRGYTGMVCKDCACAVQSEM